MILITEFMDESAVEMLRAAHEVHFDPGLADRQDDIPPLIAEARAIIVRNRTQVTDALLAAAPSLSCVGRLGVGLDNIDIGACERRGVTVYPATGANNLSVAEYVVTAALMLLRGAWFVSPQVASGAWPRAAAGAGREIAGKNLELIGYGRIARDTATIARCLGMNILAHDPWISADDPVWQDVERCDLPALLTKCDVISLHVPLTDDTRRMVDAEAFAIMKPGAVLINAARGGVIDEAALGDSLRSGHLAGAALDTFEVEPVTAASAKVFEGAPNLVLTPHIAGVTTESNERVSALTAQNVLEHLQRIPG